MITPRKKSAGIIVACAVMILMMCSSLVTFVSANQEYIYSTAPASETLATQQTANHPSGQINKAEQSSSATDTPLQLQGSVGGAGSGYIGGATAIAENSSGDLFVTDYGNQLVQVFSPTGTFLRQFNTTYQDLNVPVVIYKFNTYNNWYITGQYNTSQVGISLQPISIAINPSNGTVYVVGSQFNQIGQYSPQIEVFDASGHLIQAWSLMYDYGYTMASVAVDNQGYVYAYDSSVNMLYKFTSNGTFVAQTQLSLGGSYGYGYGNPYNTFLIPYPQIYGVSLAYSGNHVYVAGFNSQQNSCFPAQNNIQGCTVLKLNLNLSIAAAWGNTSQSDYAGGLAVSPVNGNVFVTNTSNDKVVEYGQNGSLLADFGSSGQGAGEFYYPLGLLINSVGYLYVADTQNDRVQIFDPNLGFVNMFGKPTFYGGAGESGGGFNARTGFDVINGSSIYVLDRASFGIAGGNFWRISEVNSNGMLLSRRNLDFSSCDRCSGYFNGLIVNASNGIFYTDVQFNPYNCLSEQAIAKFYANGTLDAVAVPAYAYYSPTGFGCTGYTGIATDNSGYLYTTTNIGPSTFATAFEKLDSNLQTIGNFTFGSLSNSVAAIAVDTNGNYYLSQYGGAMLTVESDTGTFYRLTLPYGWSAFTQLATDSSGNLYAASASSGETSLFVYNQQTEVGNMSLGEDIDGLSIWSNQLFAAVVQNGTAAIFGNLGYQPLVIEELSISPPTTVNFTTISGRVIDSAGNSVQGAIVVATSTTNYVFSSELASFTTTTNSDGYYSMPVIQDSYFVGVTPPQSSNLTQQWYDNQTSIVNSTAVTVPPSVVINFVLPASTVPASVSNTSELSIGNAFAHGYSQSDVVPMVNVHVPWNFTDIVENASSPIPTGILVSYPNGQTQTVPLNLSAIEFVDPPSGASQVPQTLVKEIFNPYTLDEMINNCGVSYSCPGSIYINPEQQAYAGLKVVYSCPTVATALNDQQQLMNVIAHNYYSPYSPSQAIEQLLDFPNGYEPVFFNGIKENGQFSGITPGDLSNQIANQVGNSTLNQDSQQLMREWDNNQYLSQFANFQSTGSQIFNANGPNANLQRGGLLFLNVFMILAYSLNSGYTFQSHILLASDPVGWLTNFIQNYDHGLPGKAYNDGTAILNFFNQVEAIGPSISGCSSCPTSSPSSQNPAPQLWVSGREDESGVFGYLAQPAGESCTLSGPSITVHLIDPSGTITNAVTGAPIQGAQVTLYMLNSTTNIFQPLNDSSLFSPSVNPEITGFSGAYGWLVVPGEYFVHVTAYGYYSANSSVVTVPPAITDLNVALTPVPSTNTSSSPPPSLVLGNVTWYTPTYQGLQYIFPASVAINGKQFSATFYESLFAQFQLVHGGQYAGYYAGTFGAIGGCQQGATITITATVNGVTKSASGPCPADGNSTSISMNFTSASIGTATAVPIVPWFSWIYSMGWGSMLIAVAASFIFSWRTRFPWKVNLFSTFSYSHFLLS